MGRETERGRERLGTRERYIEKGKERIETEKRDKEAQKELEKHCQLFPSWGKHTVCISRIRVPHPHLHIPRRVNTTAKLCVGGAEGLVGIL